MPTIFEGPAENVPGGVPPDCRRAAEAVNFPAPGAARGGERPPERRTPLFQKDSHRLPRRGQGPRPTGGAR